MESDYKNNRENIMHNGNYTEFEELATQLINNHAGFLPGQVSDQILHAQFALAKVYDQGYEDAIKDSPNES